MGDSPPDLELRRDGLALLAVALAALAIQLPIYDQWLSLLDEGAIAQIAVQINQGLPMYEHAVHLAFPGVFYFTAALYQLFGPSLWIGRVVMVLAFVALCALGYLLARCVTGRTLALVTALGLVAYRVWAFPHWQMLSYASLSVLLTMASVWLLALEARGGRSWLPAAAGVVLGVGVLFKQNVTLIALAALCPVLWLSTWLRGRTLGSALVRAIGFALCALLPTGVWLAAWTPSGRAAEWLYQTVWVPVVAAPLWNTTGSTGLYTDFPPLWPPWSQDPAIRHTGFLGYFPSLLVDVYWRELVTHSWFRTTPLPELFVRAVYLLPAAVLAFVGGHELWSAWRRGLRAASPAHVVCRWLLVAFGAASLAAFNRPRDWVHLLVLYPATLLLLATALEIAAGGGAPGVRRRLVVGSAIGASAAAVVASFALALASRAVYPEHLDAPRAGVRVTAHEKAVLEPLLATLRTPPGQRAQPLAALPAIPAINFLAERPLATRFLTLLPLEEFPDRDDQIVAAFERVPELDVVYTLVRPAVTDRPQDYSPEVFDYLVDHYRLGSDENLYEGNRQGALRVARLVPRREPPPESVLYDFARALDDATATVEGSDAPGEAVVRTDRWPFERPVVTGVPGLSPARLRLRYEVDLARPGALRFGVGMNPDDWRGFPCVLDFGLQIDDERALDLSLAPRTNPAHRRWHWHELPVEPGRHTIVFETSTNREVCARPRLAGWARPRIVVRAEE